MIRTIHYTGIAILALTILITLTTCRASKSQKASITSAENTKQQTSSYSATESSLYTDIRAIIQNGLWESLDFSKKETEYDSHEPVIPETGKPPLKRETQTNITRNREDKSRLVETNYTVGKSTKDSASHSTVNTSIDNKSDTLSETNMQKEPDIFFKWVGGITISLLVLSLILYTLYRYSKNRLSGL